MTAAARVLFWCETFWPSVGGLEIMAAELLPALRGRGHEFVVVAPQSGTARPEEDAYLGIPVYRFTCAPDRVDEVARVRAHVGELKRRFRPDLIHIYGVGSTIVFHHLTARTQAAPTLVTLHGAWVDGAGSLVAQTLRSADWVTGCSAAILDRGRSAVPAIASRSSVIHNGLDGPALPPAPPRFHPATLLCLGRLHAGKGIDVALTAFASIVQRFPGTRLVIAGDGPARADLERQASAQGLGRVVEFLGWVAPRDVLGLIDTCAIVLMPSRSDSFPLVALQAAVMARPVVGTRVGGMPEVITHGHTGLLVAPDDPAALAAATASLLGQSDLATRMGRAARRRAAGMFGWERHVRAYDLLYRELVAAA
jgi:glycogen(starch) synthase